MDIELTMTDDIPPNTASKSPAASTGIGLRLKGAREALHMSEKDAAARLHLSVKFIEIMEKEDFENGPPVTFMRGYMRSYAKLLNLPTSEIENAMQQLGMNKVAATPLAPKLGTPLTNNNERYIRWFTYAISLLLLGLVGIWWSTHAPKNLNKNLLPLELKNVEANPSTVNRPTTTPTENPTTNTPATPVDSTNHNSGTPITKDVTPTTPISNAPGNPAPPVPAVVPKSDQLSTPATTDNAVAQPAVTDTQAATAMQNHDDASPQLAEKPKRHHRPKYLEDNPDQMPEAGLENE